MPAAAAESSKRTHTWAQGSALGCYWRPWKNSFDEGILVKTYLDIDANLSLSPESHWEKRNWRK